MSYKLVSNIMFYGPTAAGKTSLLKSFLYATSEQAYSPITHSKGRMKIILEWGPDEDSLSPVTPEECDLSKIVPTQLDVTDTFKLRRLPISQRSSHQEKLSKSEHTGRFRDRRGGDYIETIIGILNQDDGQSGRNLKEIEEIIQATLADSLCIIAILDPSQPKIGNLTYRELLQPLRVLPEQVNGIPRHIAFCVNKIDTPGFPRAETKEYMLMHFGISDIFRDFAKRFRVELFKVSTWGFLQDKRTPNFQNNAYVDRDTWVPYNVHEPFFWAFQSIELEMLKRQADARPRYEKLVEPTEKVIANYINYY